jgi:hypothetical protein
MSGNHKTEAECNGALFIENTNKFPPEELARYAGRCVAGNLEGTKILASGADHGEFYANLAAARIELSSVV